MEGIIANFRRGRHTQTPTHMIIYVDSIKNKTQAKALVGKTVKWKNPKGNEFTGKIAGSHGNSGALRAIFAKGLPGQSLGNKVEII